MSPCRERPPPSAPADHRYTLDLVVPKDDGRDLLYYRSGRERAERTSALGMVIFLGSWAMMFASLFFAYGLVRARAQAWPPDDLPHLPRLQPGLSTLVLMGSSVALQLGVRAVRERRERLAAPLIGLTLLLGIGFVALQGHLWSSLFQAGLTPRTGTYASVFWGLTGFHALHVLVGLFALVWLVIRALGRAYSAARFSPLRLWAMYWHFVGVVWIAIYATVFLL